MIGGDHRAGAGHVLNDEFRIARDVLSEQTGVGARPLIVIIAGLITDDDADRLSLIKRSLRAEITGPKRKDETEQKCRLFHHSIFPKPISSFRSLLAVER